MTNQTFVLHEAIVPGASQVFTKLCSCLFLPNKFVMQHLGAVLGMALSTAILTVPGNLTEPARIALAVTVLCVTGWTFTRLPDSLVAIAGALALVLFGTVKEDALFSALGHEMIWLMLAAFIMAAIMKVSGLLDVLASKLLRHVSSLPGLFYTLTALITATAFVIPSTSGRAALFLPVFLGLAARMPDARLVKSLALLFPTIILLSAGGSLIGAGAHIIATDAIHRAGGPQIGFASWAMLALPIAALSCIAATALILMLFVPKDLSGIKLKEGEANANFTAQQRRISLVIFSVVAAWATQPWHGISIATIAVAGSALLMTGPFTSLKSKDVFRAVELELIIFLATATVMANAIVATGADRWLASNMMSALPVWAEQSALVMASVLTIVALISHIFINSRSARAAVLVPALALPVVALGHDAQSMVLLAVLGTGFCQTTMVSAKPVAIFGKADVETFDASDLLRLAAPLMTVMFALLVIFAVFVWPQPSRAQPAQPAHVTQLVTQMAMPSPAAAMAARLPEPDLSGARCTPGELRTVIIGAIAERRMWASGWWKVWRTLRNQGYPVERTAIRAIYRGEDLVTLRQKSKRVAEVVGDAAALATARQACKN